jgi:hypothetical protein
MDGLWGSAAPKAAPPEKPKEPPKAGTNTDTPPAPEKPAGKVTPQSSKDGEQSSKPAVQSPTADDIADRVAQRLKPAAPAAPAAPAPVDPDAGLEAEDREKLKVLHYMAQQDPKLATKELEYRNFLKKEQAYVSKWVKEHPGQAFEGEDSEHEDFYERETPDLDDKQVQRWETEMIAEEKTSRMLERDRQERHSTTLVETIRANITDTNRAIAKDVLAEVAGKDIKTLKALADDDPLAAEAVYEAVATAQSIITASEALLTAGTPYKVNQNDPSHQELLHRLLHPPETLPDGTQSLSYEGEIAALPAAEQVWTMQDGTRKPFATLEQFNRMPPEQRSRYWTLVNHPEIVASFVRRDARAEVKQLVEKKHAAARKTATKLGFAPPVPNRNPVAENGEQNGGTPPSTGDRTSSPSLSDSAQPVTTLNPQTADSGNLADLISKGLFG